MIQDKRELAEFFHEDWPAKFGACLFFREKASVLFYD